MCLHACVRMCTGAYTRARVHVHGRVCTCMHIRVPACLCEKEVKGAVYSMVEFNGKLLASINSTVSPPSGLSLRPPSTDPGSCAFSPSGLGLRPHTSV